MTISNAHFPVLLVLLWVTVACTPSESPSDAPAAAATEPPTPAVSAGPSPGEIATSIEASKSELRSETQTSTMGGIERTETRFYVGSTLVLVEEVLGVAGEGGSITAFYFDDDRLVYFRGRGTRTIFVPGADEKVEQFDIELGYDPEGNVVEAVKIIDGEPAPLEPFDYEAPKARARMLLGENLG